MFWSVLSLDVSIKKFLQKVYISVCISMLLRKSRLKLLVWLLSGFAALFLVISVATPYWISNDERVLGGSLVTGDSGLSLFSIDMTPCWRHGFKPNPAPPHAPMIILASHIVTLMQNHRLPAVKSSQFLKFPMCYIFISFL